MAIQPLPNIGKASGRILKNFWALRICEPVKHNYKKMFEWKAFRMRKNSNELQFFDLEKIKKSWPKPWKHTKKVRILCFPCLLVCCGRMRRNDQLCSKEDETLGKIF